jgi:hypothetical protein
MINYINQLSDDEQIKLIYERQGIEQWKCLKSLNNPSEKVKLAIIKLNPYYMQVFKNLSNELQLEYVRSIDFDKFDDELIAKYITSPKAKELYYKIKSAKNIIK